MGVIIPIYLSYSHVIGRIKLSPLSHSLAGQNLGLSHKECRRGDKIQSEPTNGSLTKSPIHLDLQAQAGHNSPSLLYIASQHTKLLHQWPFWVMRDMRRVGEESLQLARNRDWPAHAKKRLVQGGPSDMQVPGFPQARDHGACRLDDLSLTISTLSHHGLSGRVFDHFKLPESPL